MIDNENNKNTLQTIALLSDKLKVKKYLMNKNIITGNIQPDYFYNIDYKTPDFEKIKYIDYGL